MKKQTKAAIAVGAGAILLLGGAGSLAFWRDEAVVPGGQISSGELSLDECAGGGTWTDLNDPTVPIQPIDLTNFRIVPGDTIVYTCATNINATGDNLTATLSADVTPVVGGNTALAAALTPTVTATVGGTTLVPGPTGIQITPNAGVQSAVITVAITFDPATLGLTAQNETADLTAMTLVLQQNDNPVAGP